jgi:hypothetical protein
LEAGPLLQATQAVAAAAIVKQKSMRKMTPPAHGTPILLGHVNPLR